MTTQYLIRNFFRSELEEMQRRAEEGKSIMFFPEEIGKELARRDVIEEKRRDTFRYPELQRFFH